MLIHRRTKIVATMGPATEDEKVLRACIEAGLNVARLNFSHSTHKEHEAFIKKIHKISNELHAPVAILQDLQGPKIRVGNIEDKEVHPGDKVFLSYGQKPSKTNHIPVDLEDLHKYTKAGDRVLIDDGLIELLVTKVSGQKVHCEVINKGTIKKRKGVNFPNTSLPMSSLTPKDIKDLKFGLKHDVDHVALSFVRTAKDIEELRKYINKSKKPARIVAKIEMAEAIEHLDEIIEAADAIMVARGDLAVEVGQARLAGLQKKIIAACNKKGKPVITATQMLESMRDNPRPTRAEITDVVNAVLDGSDALMLSAESASGKHPAVSIKTMHDLIVEAELSNSIYNKINLENKISNIPGAISVSAALCAFKLDAKAIVCLSTTGRTARLISRFRPKAHLIAATDKDHTLRSLELCWGVQTLPVKRYEDWEDIFESLEPLLLSHGIVEPGDQVVLTLGLPIKHGVKTNSLRVFTVGGSKSGVKSKAARFRPSK